MKRMQKDPAFRQYIMHVGGHFMVLIDFSCRHDILIRNPDGTLSPMDEPFYRSEKVGDGIWKILSSGDYHYLIEGDSEAVAFDTGYGAGNVREYLQTLTDKPVKNVINSHDHFDHTANNGYFEKAYMGILSIPLATKPFASFAGIEFITDYERIGLKEGDIYDPGNRPLEVFDIPDHAVGSIALLDRKGRALFSGDEFMRRGKNLRVSVSTYFGYLEKLMKHRNEFDILCAGGGVLGADLIDRQYACAKHILDGHEGVPCDDSRPKHPLEYSGDGRLIYDRIKPHPGDGGSEQGGTVQMYRMEYADTVITYSEI